MRPALLALALCLIAAVPLSEASAKTADEVGQAPGADEDRSGEDRSGEGGPL